MSPRLALPAIVVGAILALSSAAQAAVVFTPAKITVTGPDGAIRVFEPSAMGADSFAQFARSSRPSVFGFAVVGGSAANATPYPFEVIVVGPATELHISTDQSVARWAFMPDDRVKLCSAPLHGPAEPVCRTYRLPGFGEP